MRMIVAGVILAVAWLQAQTAQQLLLPQAKRIVGVVMDPDGKPVVGARIDHSGNRLRTYETDSNGRFELDTRAPALVIRKAGFRSGLVKTKDASEVRVTLQPQGANPSFPNCSAGRQYNGLAGGPMSFQFPRIPGVTASRPGRDIDYVARNYYVETKQGPKGIMHGSGPSWTYGLPSDRDIWRTAKYEEAVFDLARLTIIDARGQLPDASRWRYLARFGESASYSDVDEATAKILDQVLDGACVKR